MSVGIVKAHRALPPAVFQHGVYVIHAESGEAFGKGVEVIFFKIYFRGVVEKTYFFFTDKITPAF